MTLRIALRDGEKMVVNGAVLRSVGRTDLCIDSKAAVLRGREVMSPEEANTPARQLYFHTMMAYIDPDGAGGHQDRIIASLRDVAAMLPGDDARSLAASFARHAAGLSYYKALSDCRALIRLESEALAEVREQAAA